MRTTTRTGLALLAGFALAFWSGAQEEQNLHVEGVPEVGEAVAFFKKGEHDKGNAIIDRGAARLRKALQDEPAQAATWHYQLGQLYYYAHRDEPAIASFKQAAASGSRERGVYSRLVELSREAGDDEETLRWLVKLVEVDPSDEVSQWNLAQAWQLAGKAKESRTAFMAIAKRVPNEWKAYSKVIQLSERIGDKKTRDDWHARLYALRKRGEIKELAEVDFFIRDQYDVGDTKVYGLEYFEMLGERKVKYSFNLRDAKTGDSIGKISLGSYDSTNAIGQAMGDVTKGNRLFHLDGYYPDGSHSTFGFFDGNPGYDVIKPKVADVLREKLKPVSRMIPNDDGAEIELNE